MKTLSTGRDVLTPGKRAMINQAAKKLFTHQTSCQESGNKHDMIGQFSLSLQSSLTRLNSHKGGIKNLINIASYK